MGVPKLNKVKLKQSAKKTSRPCSSDTDNIKDKKVIQQYAEKIHDLVKDENEARKLAIIISNYINSKK